MAGILTLNDVIIMPFGSKLRDLFFVFGDVVIDRVAPCVKEEVNTWVSHAWYEPRHEVGRVVFIQGTVFSEWW